MTVHIARLGQTCEWICGHETSGQRPERNLALSSCRTGRNSLVFFGEVRLVLCVHLGGRCRVVVRARFVISTADLDLVAHTSPFRINPSPCVMCRRETCRAC